MTADIPVAWLHRTVAPTIDSHSTRMRKQEASYELGMRSHQRALRHSEHPH